MLMGLASLSPQIYQDMFTSYNELSQLKEVAEILALKSDWPVLYDEARLSRNEVPVYAATYMNDMFVHFELASATATKIKGLKQFITNVMYHNAVTTKPDEVMRQLWALKEDTID